MRGTAGRSLVAAIAIVTGVAAPRAPPRAAQETTLAAFAGGAPGRLSGLVRDSRGNLYTVLADGGTGGFGAVVKLTPAASGGGDRQGVIHSFQGAADGAAPRGALAIDPLIHGTASGGGNGVGDVFKLAPPALAGTPWSETTLYSFAKQGGAGNTPEATLLRASGSTLYGTTSAGAASKDGAAFAISP